MRTPLLVLSLALLVSSCTAKASFELADAAVAADTVAADSGSAADPLEITWDQLSLGCAKMGSGAAEHVMCNHGHSFSLHNEGLYERWLYLKDHGITSPNEAQLMMHGPLGTGTLPEPMTPLLRARLGEQTRIRVVSYGGTQFHTFHLHGHLWKDDGQLVDNVTLGPMEVYDKAQFYAGAYADKPELRGGVGDWMYHCHVEVHALTGMWGLFRVLPTEVTASTGEDLPDSAGHYPHELPIPAGNPGDTREIYVVAAEVPLTIARSYSLADKALEPVQRLARLYVPMPDAQGFQAATAESIAKQLENQAETWQPWVLSLWLNQTVHVHLKNVMADVPVSLHPHGVKYANSEDGTMPEDVAQPGGPEVVMTWTADTAGTWPLHDHARAIENIGRGLFAAIVVQDPAEKPKLVRDYVIFLHDFDMDWVMGANQPTGDGH